MWELIEKNKRKSLFVLILMFILMTVLSGAIGFAIEPHYGAYWGAGFGILLWAVQSLVAYFLGDDIVLHFNMAVVVTPESSPQLYNIVEEMKIAAGLQVMPEIYIVQSPGLNAFATGIRPEKTAICVTSGLVENLNRDEIQGVVAHEMSHILNRDVLFMTFAGVMLGTITMLSNALLRGTIFANSDRRTRKRSGVPGSHPVVIIVLLLLAIFAPILARIFYFTISKKREYLADATAARLTRYPIGLASALEKIAKKSSVSFVSKISAPMFIVNPHFAGGDEDSIFSASTHPPIYKRIAILTQLQHGGTVSLGNYQKLYDKEVEKSPLLSNAVLKADTGEKVRLQSVDETAPEQSKEVEDIILANAGFKILTCECGLKIKLPPSSMQTKVKCPRCKRELSAESGSLDTASSENGETELVFKRTTLTAWESFPCQCGNFTFQLSPLFRGTYAVCKRCGTKVKIEYPE